MIRKNLMRYGSLLALATALLLGGCSEDGGNTDETVKQTTDELTFSIQVPASDNAPAPASRAIVEGADDDNYVSEVMLLLFNGSGKLTHTLPCDNIIQAEGTNTRIKTVKTRLPQGTYKVVVLANAKDLFLAQSFAMGDDISKIQNIVLAHASFGKKWNSIPGSTGYRYFPMWGEVAGNVTIPRDVSAPAVEADLYRMLAKINVTVDKTGSSFVLQSISVYNYDKSGWLVPAAANFAAGKATEKVDRQSGSSPTPLRYTNANTDGVGGASYNYIADNGATGRYECIDEIFVFESAASTGAWAWDKDMCVVIGGTYAGQPAYYRLDFIVSGSYVDVRRNYKYIFDVEAIKTPGYVDEDTALKLKPENLKYTVTPWDESKIGDLIVDGPTQLTVSPGSVLTFKRNPASQTLSIYTNWAAGWQVPQKDYSGTMRYRVEDATTGAFADWVTLDKYSIGAAGVNDVVVSVSDNDTGAERKAYIYITCGRIQHRLTIIQNIKSLEFTFIDYFVDGVAKNYITAGTNATAIPISTLEATSVLAKVSTNSSWTLTSSLGTSRTSAGPGTDAADYDYMSVTIPPFAASDLWVSSKYTTLISKGYDGVEHKAVFIQGGYKVTGIVRPSPISGLKTTIKVQLIGYYPAGVLLRAVLNTSPYTDVVSESDVVASTSIVGSPAVPAEGPEVSMVITSNMSESSRLVRLQYSSDGGTTWLTPPGSYYFTQSGILWGGENHVLYFKTHDDSSVSVEVGRWGGRIESRDSKYDSAMATVGSVTSVDDMAYFMTGGVIGVTFIGENGIARTLDDIVFNPTIFTVGPSAPADITSYSTIPCYSTADYTDKGVRSFSDVDASGFPLATALYHTPENVRRYGKGDPCKLAGLNPAKDFAGMDESQIEAYLAAYDSGWRMATSNEGKYFFGITSNGSSPGSYWNLTSNPLTCSFPIKAGYHYDQYSMPMPAAGTIQSGLSVGRGSQGLYIMGALGGSNSLSYYHFNQSSNYYISSGTFGTIDTKKNSFPIRCIRPANHPGLE